MYHLLDLLRKSRVVSNLDIITFVDEEDVQIFSVKAALCDGSFLFVRELITASESKYSYHWQTKNGTLICRWDNAPHYPHLATSPHHKHEGAQKNVATSQEVTLEMALAVIEQRIRSS